MAAYHLVRSEVGTLYSLRASRRPRQWQNGPPGATAPALRDQWRRRCQQDWSSLALARRSCDTAERTEYRLRSRYVVDVVAGIDAEAMVTTTTALLGAAVLATGLAAAEFRWRNTGWPTSSWIYLSMNVMTRKHFVTWRYNLLLICRPSRLQHRRACKLRCLFPWWAEEAHLCARVVSLCLLSESNLHF